MGEIFAESLFDAVLDCVKVAPVLFLAYLLVSYLSHDHRHKFSRFLSKNKKTSVLYASFLGCVPQCGFSSVIADLYSEKKVSIGTLVAVFVATSDEALPIMISNTNQTLNMLLLIGVKIILALFWGYIVDIIARFISKRKLSITSRIKQRKQSLRFKSGENCKHETNPVKSEANIHHCGHIHTEKCDDKCGHKHGDCCVDNVFLDAFMHMLNIIIYIFVATLIINVIVGYWGTEVLQNLFTDNVYFQILIASLIGLIPNCASSVLLVELFIHGTLAFPALVAGLTAGAGVGLVILWTKNHKQPLKNLGIMFLQYFIGVTSGLFLTLFF